MQTFPRTHLLGWKLPETKVSGSILKVVCAHLSVEASIREAKQEAGEECNLKTWLSNICIVRCFFQGSIWRQVYQHKEVGQQAEDEAKDDDRMAASLHSEVAHETEEYPANNLSSSHDDASDSCQRFRGEAVRAQPDINKQYGMAHSYCRVNPMQVV